MAKMSFYISYTSSIVNLESWADKGSLMLLCSVLRKNACLPPRSVSGFRAPRQGLCPARHPLIGPIRLGLCPLKVCRLGAMGGINRILFKKVLVSCVQHGYYPGPSFKVIRITIYRQLRADIGDCAGRQSPMVCQRIEECAMESCGFLGGRLRG
jgi:hypothetical protein